MQTFGAPCVGRFSFPPGGVLCLEGDGHGQEPRQRQDLPRKEVGGPLFPKEIVLGRSSPLPFGLWGGQSCSASLSCGHSGDKSEAAVPHCSQIVTFALNFRPKKGFASVPFCPGWVDFWGSWRCCCSVCGSVSLGEIFVLLLPRFFTHFKLSVERRTFCLFLLTFALQVM